MRVLVFSLSLATTIVLACHESCVGTQLADQKMQGQTKKLLADIIRIEGSQFFASDNSQVIVKTPAIKEITDQGLPILEVLINAMRDEKIDFDAFLRCYSACDQILRKAGSKRSVWWSGGSRWEWKDGRQRFVFGFPWTDEQKFRKRVVEDIVEKRRKGDAANTFRQGGTP
jgi:hypothetical protein